MDYRFGLFFFVQCCTFILQCADISWLHKFYKWLSDTDNRTENIKTKPIFLDENGNAASAYDYEGHSTLFLPVDNIQNENTIKIELLENDNTKKFIEKVGISTPSLKDHIFAILKLYEENNIDIDNTSHFNLIFDYLQNCNKNNYNEIVNKLKNYAIIDCYKNDASNKKFREIPSNIYFDDPVLKEYFEVKPDTLFISMNEYSTVIEKYSEEKIINFFTELGVNSTIRIYKRKLDWDEVFEKSNELPRPYSTQGHKYTETTIDGLKENIEYIIQNRSSNKSKMLFSLLSKINNIETHSYYRGLQYILKGQCWYFYYQSHIKDYTCEAENLLRNAKWLLNKEGDYVSANELSIDDLAEIYDIESENSKLFLDYLKIKSKVERQIDYDSEEFNNLTDDQKNRMKVLDQFHSHGFSDDEINEILEEAARKKKQNQLQSRIDYTSTDDESSYDQDASFVNNHTSTDKEVDNIVDDTDKISKYDDTSAEAIEDENSDDFKISQKVDRGIAKITKDVLKRSNKLNQEHTEINEKEHNSFDEFEEDYFDSDEFSPSPINFTKKADREKEKAAKAINKIAQQEALQERALKAKKYTFEWFNALLDLEAIGSKFEKYSRPDSAKRAQKAKPPDSG